MLSLLHLEQNGLGKPHVILTRVNLASFEQYSPEIADALLRDKHLVVGLNQCQLQFHDTAFPADELTALVRRLAALRAE